MLDYKLIKAVAAVARENGFDKAAKVLNITQSAVSQRVKALEEHTGQILIARTTPPTPTDAGLKIVKHYQQVTQLEHDLSCEIERKNNKQFSSLTIGINADSLDTWFLEAIAPLLRKEHILLDTLVDDQEQTHKMLKNGSVIGCISTQNKPLQGCRVEYLGCMNYSLVATPKFIEKWFPTGFTLKAAHEAPAVIFNRKDELHHKLFKLAFGDIPKNFPIHYIPSTEQFARLINMDLAYGMLPNQQTQPFLDSGEMVDLAPQHQIPIKLYWHCWNLNSHTLKQLTDELTKNAKKMLAG